MKKTKRKAVLGFTLSAALAATSLALPATTQEAQAATDWEYTYPTTAMTVESANADGTTSYSVPTTDGKKVATTMTIRAGSYVPLVYGVNIMGGQCFADTIFLSGTDVNENPDPFTWNYLYELQRTGQELSGSIASSLSTDEYSLPTGYADSVVYYATTTGQTNANGLYQAIASNQSYGGAIDELGGIGYAIGWRTDVIFSFNSVLLDQIDIVHSWEEGDEYYIEGDEDYSPVFAEVQSAAVSGRLYAWNSIGKTLSAYFEEHPELTTRYDDPLIIGEDVEQFCAGIVYYIGSLIADGTIEKKTAAYVNSISDNTLTLVDPSNIEVISADVYGEGHNFNFIEGNYTLSQLMDEYNVDLIILGSSGYSYTPSGSSSAATEKAAVLAELADLGYTEDDIPLVMDSDNISMGSYSGSPTAAMAMPFVQTYAYMDELAEVNEAINPTAMYEYIVDEFYHIKDESVYDVALYYIGSSWDAVDDVYDQVPDTTAAVYDKDAIVEAIRIGAAYALSGEAEENGNYLNPSCKSNEMAYKLLMESATTEVPEAGHDYITLTVSGVENYLDLTELLESEDSSDSSGGRTQYEAIIEYYYSGDYGYAANLQEALQTYANHMVQHVWVPDTDVEGTYTYGVSGDDWNSNETLAVRRNNTFYISCSNESSVADVKFTYGKNGDEILTGDWDGDGLDTIAVRRGNVYYFLNTSMEEITDGEAYVADTVLTYGKSTDEVLAGDWDGDGSDTLAVRRGDTYYFSNDLQSSTAATVITIGSGTETAVTGDWDGDGADTVCLNSGNKFTVYNAVGTAAYSYTYGSSKKIYEVLAGDWNGDGVDTICLRNENVYYFTNSATAGSTYRELAYGKSTDDVFTGCWK